MAKRKIAGKTEVLEHLTEVMRSEDGAKPADKMKAAELIGKHLGVFGDKKTQETGVKVVIVDDVAIEPKQNARGVKVTVNRKPVNVNERTKC